MIAFALALMVAQPLPGLARACPTVMAALDPGAQGFLDGDPRAVEIASASCAAPLGRALSLLRRAQAAVFDPTAQDAAFSWAREAAEVAAPLSSSRTSEAAAVLCEAKTMLLDAAVADETCAGAVAIAPNNAYAWMARGDALRLGGKPDGALKAYAQALTLAPGFGAAEARRAAVLLDQDRFAEAAASLSPLAEKRSRFAIAAADAELDAGQRAVAMRRLEALSPPQAERRLEGLRLIDVLPSLARTWARDGRCDSPAPQDFLQILTFVDWTARRGGEPDQVATRAADRAETSISQLAASDLVRRIEIRLALSGPGGIEMIEQGARPNGSDRFVAVRAAPAGRAGADAVSFSLRVDGPLTLELALSRRDFGATDWREIRAKFAPCPGRAPPWPNG